MTVFVVKDLFARRDYNVPDRIGIGPHDRGLAFGALLAELEMAQNHVYLPDYLGKGRPCCDAPADQHPTKPR